MSSAQVDGCELYYEESGSGPALLLIAGIPGIVSDWAPVVEGMSGSRRVIAYDNRGSGRSSVTRGPYTTPQLAADAAALLDQLGIERADVFGMSLGGMIAQELAVGWPQRIGRLVLGCTHPGVEHAASPPKETGRAFAMHGTSWRERMEVLAPLALSSNADPELLGALIEKKAGDEQAEEGYRAHVQAVLDHDSYDRLPQIRCPTLIVTGDDDRIIPGASSDVLHRQIPDSTLRVVRGAGHLFFLEQPEQTGRLLEAFLD